MFEKKITIKGAREHNLRIDHLELPKNKLIVFTGVSGSGKSSLAFDTLYAEGQRRYIESLSSYARQFLGQLDKPKYDKLSGLSPTIAIEQKSASNNPRSTVGTITEIYDYMRVLWARVGVQHCHQCGKIVAALTPEQIVDEIRHMPKGKKARVLAPLIMERKGEHRELIDRVRERGFTRILLDGQEFRLDETIPALEKKQKHTINIIVDRIEPGITETGRLYDSVETALKEASGEILIEDGEGVQYRYSTSRACSYCKIGFPDLSPVSFSFNSPVGACPACDGLGTRLEVDPNLVVPNSSLSIRQGALLPLSQIMQKGTGWNVSIFESLSSHLGIDLDLPWHNLSEQHKQIILFGYGGKKFRVEHHGRSSTWSGSMKFEGVANTILRRLHQTNSEEMRQYYQQFLSNTHCTECNGKRLRPESLAVRVGNSSIADVCAKSVEIASNWFDSLSLTGTKAVVAHELVKEINQRLVFLRNVGLSYLTLDRLGPSLSGGEAQRIRLASQLGSELSGVLYILDEPSIGLHPRDSAKLITALEGLKNLGNTVIVVEHDHEAMARADHIVDFGPGAGKAGGLVVGQGTPAALKNEPLSLTGQYLSGARSIEIPGLRRMPRGNLSLEGATLNNLKNVDLHLPLGVLSVFTGVSGAGKSSLVTQTLLPALQRRLHGAVVHSGPFRSLTGEEQIDKVVHIDQKPIGRTPRSNPVTYTKAFDEIRSLLSETPQARTYGFGPGRFSFNVSGGRCESCSGAGFNKVEMHFLADVYVPCEVCHGDRYNETTLQVQFKGRNIREILDLTVSEALDLFCDFPKVFRILKTLEDVGMGYVQLGQSATTLSGGEAQRIKLSRELSRRDTGRTLYVLDEPTTGLHFEDVKKLLAVLQSLVDRGNTVAVIEHNLEVVKCADWVVDLGPEGGADGGYIVGTGTPEDLCSLDHCITGRFLSPILGGNRAA
jgi:excinuclease ABC subunit A